MTEYRNIHGKRIKSFATDLDNEQAEGQLFYSETSDDFKVAVPSSAWHSSGPLITARRYLAGAGTQTAAFGAGGISPVGAGAGNRSAKTEHYDGTGWSNGGNLATATNNKVGAGTFTAG